VLVSASTTEGIIRGAMASMEEKFEMKRMVLTDLATLCKELSDSSAITQNQRVQVRQFVEEYNLVFPFFGKGILEMDFEGHKLLIRMARFLPNLATN